MEDSLKNAFETLSSTAMEWFEDGVLFGEEGFEDQENNTYAMKRLGKKMEKYQNEILNLIYKLDHKKL